jgi:hypothetical protein
MVQPVKGMSGCSTRACRAPHCLAQPAVHGVQEGLGEGGLAAAPAPAQRSHGGRGPLERALRGVRLTLCQGGRPQPDQRARVLGVQL